MRAPHVSAFLARRRAHVRAGVEVGLSSDSASVPRARSPGDPTPLFKAPLAPCTALSRAPRPPPQTLAPLASPLLGLRRRLEPVPPLSFARLGVALWIRREVRSPPVQVGCASALRVAGSPSPELNRRRGSPCAVVLRRRRPGGSPEVSPSARGRPGANPASFGAS
jgi:hypothetical protein